MCYTSHIYYVNINQPQIKNIYTLMELYFSGNIKEPGGWAQWLTLVIPALWEAEVGRSLEVRSWKPAWPTW